jgi:hypothetical protein
MVRMTILGGGDAVFTSPLPITLRYLHFVQYYKSGTRDILLKLT